MLGVVDKLLGETGLFDVYWFEYEQAHQREFLATYDCGGLGVMSDACSSFVNFRASRLFIRCISVKMESAVAVCGYEEGFAYVNQQTRDTVLLKVELQDDSYK